MNKRLYFQFYDHYCIFPFLSNVLTSVRFPRTELLGHSISVWSNYLFVIGMKPNSIVIRGNTTCDFNPLEFFKSLL